MKIKDLSRRVTKRGGLDALSDLGNYILKEEAALEVNKNKGNTSLIMEISTNF